MLSRFNFTRKHYLLVFVVLIIVIISISKVLSPENNSISYFQPNTAALTTRLTNPNSNFTLDPEIIDKTLQKKVLKDINYFKQNDKITNISVYYRNLSTNRWFSANENKQYTPASLFKIYTLITTLQYAIDYPEFLDQQVTYHGEFDNIKNVSSKSQPKKEETYTIDKLLWYTFTYSDNVSLNLIQAQLEEKDPGSLNKAKIDFNMPLSRDDSLIKIIPYAQTFEALYTSSCLSQDMSEKALSFLTEASFNEGISEPLDPSIPIANKFGYRIHDFGNLNELHDCGIVYKPQNPYLICVMTKGKSKTIQASAISKISKTIWDHLDR